MQNAHASALQPVGFDRFKGLDGLRAISIALVLIAHGWDSIPDVAGLKGAVGTYAHNGRLGVQVFFVLSGFLITHLLAREVERYGRIDLKRFYARRALRIFPALYTYLFVIAVLALLGLVQTTGGDLLRAGTFLTNYAFLMNPATNSDYWFVGHFWTLSLEEQFYLLWPVTLIAIGLRWGRSVAAAIILLTPFVRTGSYFVWPGAREHLMMMLHTAADSIMMGGLAALWLREESLKRRFAARWAGVVALLAALFVLFPSAWLTVHLKGAYFVTVGTTIDAMAIAFVVLYLVTHPTSQTVRWLETMPLRTIGVLSYSLYLWQQLFLGSPRWAWAVFPLNYLACIAAAVLSNFAIERPFLRLRGRFTPRPPVVSQSVNESPCTNAVA